MARIIKSKPHGRLKLSHHRHTGKRLPHHHTSYGGLIVLTVVAGIMLAFATVSTLKAQTLQSSQSVSVSGVVPAPPPQEAATVTQPTLVRAEESKPGERGLDFDTLAISGVKLKDTIVEIYNNELLAGAAGCRSEGYSLKITPQYGNNLVVAKVVDNLGQYGPDSKTASVVYLPKSKLEPQFLLSGASKYFGLQVNQKHELLIKIIGGQAPYAISVDWGDNKETDLSVHRTSGKVKLSHRYDTTGCYNIIVQGEDNKGGKAYFRT